MLNRIAGSRVEDVLIACTFMFEKTFIIARAHNRLSIDNVQPGEYGFSPRRANTDSRRSAIDLANNSKVSADVDYRVFDAGIA